MKFSDFLLNEDENLTNEDNAINAFLKNILNDVKKEDKNIIVLNSLYTKEYKNKNEILKDNKIDGYFVYNKNDPGDNNFYTGTFNHNTLKNETEVSFETSDPYASINDIDFFIKTKLKAFKI